MNYFGNNPLLRPDSAVGPEGAIGPKGAIGPEGAIGPMGPMGPPGEEVTAPSLDLQPRTVTIITLTISLLLLGAGLAVLAKSLPGDAHDASWAFIGLGMVGVVKAYRRTTKE